MSPLLHGAGLFGGLGNSGLLERLGLKGGATPSPKEMVEGYAKTYEPETYLYDDYGQDSAYYRHGEGYTGDGYTGDGYTGAGYEGDGYTGSGYEGEGYGGSGYEGNGYTGDSYTGDGAISTGYEGNGYAGDAYSGEGYEGESYEGEGYEGNSYSGVGYEGDGYAGGGYDPQGTGTARTKGPERDKPVSAEEMFRELEFDPEGDSEEWNAAKNPWDAIEVLKAKDEAFAKTTELFPDQGHHNNEADAFRHAYWNYLITQRIGGSEAKKFGDAHERYSENEMGETLMDLYNNNIGRSLAQDEQNAGRDPAEVIREAIEAGRLRVTPFEVEP